MLFSKTVFGPVVECRSSLHVLCGCAVCSKLRVQKCCFLYLLFDPVEDCRSSLHAVRSKLLEVLCFLLLCVSKHGFQKMMFSNLSPVPATSAQALGSTVFPSAVCSKARLSKYAVFPSFSRPGDECASFWKTSHSMQCNLIHCASTAV